MSIIFIILILGINISNGLRTNHDIIMDYIDDNYDIENLDVFYTYVSSKDWKSIYFADISKLLTQLLNRYVYLDISVNSEGSDYPIRADLRSYIGSSSNNFYEAYQNYKKKINSAQDGHLDLILNDKYEENKYVRESTAISPIEIYISKEGEEIKYFAIPSEYISKFPDEIRDKIEQNKNRPIFSINDKSPKEYIYNFNDGYKNYRSKQANFVKNQHLIKSVNLNFYPFSKDHLQNIKLTYSGNYETIYYDYLLLKPKNGVHNPLFNDFKSNYYEEKGLIQNNLDVYEMVKLYLNKNNILKDSLDVEWDKSTKGEEIKCKVDDTNNVNVIYQNRFKFKKGAKKEAKDVLDYCFESFYKNTYPIIIIEDYNGGGSINIADYLTEYLNLNRPNYIYSAYRYNQDVKDNVASLHKNRNYKTCKFENYKNLFNSKNEIYYGKDSNGNDIKHEITQLFNGMTIDKYNFYDFRENHKNIRKPNEIIIFTDGYSYSATSHFIKQTQLRKGAIIVGYGGDPEETKFDASLSPTTVENTENAGNVKDNIGESLENLGFRLFYSIRESFTYHENIKYPMEFEKIPIDERANLYNKYDDSRYQEFIDEAKKIFNKYNNENCNSENKNILLLSEECDIALNPNTHGGYECGDNNKWSDICVPLYCDIGYYFDIVKKECVEDPCYLLYKEKKEKEKKEKEKKEFVFMILFIVGISVSVISFIIYIYRCIIGEKEYNTFLIIITIVFFILFVVSLFLWLKEKGKI